MDPKDPLDLLDEALRIAVTRGWDASGWMLTNDEDGYSAWLYETTDDSETSMWSDIELMPTPLMAAKECYSRACKLEDKLQFLES